MTTARTRGVFSALFWVCLLAIPAPLAAHNCSSQADCEDTAGYLTAVAVAGGAVAVVSGLLGGSVAAGAGTVPPGSGPVPPTGGSTGPTLFDPDTGEPLIVQDGTYEGGEPGQVWSPWEGWVDWETAAQHVRERQTEIDARQREIDAFDRETGRRSEARARANEDAAAEAEARRGDEAARQQRLDELRRRGAGLIGRVEDPVRAQQLESFLERHRNDPDALERAIGAIRSQTFEADQQRSMGEAESALAEGEALERSAATASLIETAARGGVAATGGAMLAAGAAVASAVTAGAAATGAIGFSGAGAESRARGDSLGQQAGHALAGGAIGALEGAVAVGAQAASGAAQTGIRMVGGGVADFADHARRTGNIQGAAVQGAIGVVFGAADAILPGGPMGTALDAGAAGLEGGLRASAQGGDFEQGMRDGFTNWGAGRIGSGAAGRAASSASGTGFGGSTPAPSPRGPSTPPGPPLGDQIGGSMDGGVADGMSTPSIGGAAVGGPAGARSAVTGGSVGDVPSRPPGDTASSRPASQDGGASRPRADDAGGPRSLGDDLGAEAPPPRQPGEGDLGGDGDVDGPIRPGVTPPDGEVSTGRRQPSLADEIDALIREQEGKGGSTELESVDANDARTNPAFGGEETSMQGRGASAEETNRREVWLRPDGTRVMEPNPEDSIAPTESRIRVDPDTGEARVVHGAGVPDAHKPGIEARLLDRNRGRIEQTLGEERARIARVRAQNELEAARQRLAEAEARLRDAQETLDQTPEDSDDFIPRYGDRADAQGDKTLAERAELEARMRAMEAQEAAAAAPEGGSLGNELGSPGRPTAPMGQNRDTLGRWDIDADNSLDPLDRYATGEPIPGFVPQVRAKDCSIAIMTRETGRSYDDVFREMRPMLTPEIRSDGSLGHGGLPPSSLGVAMDKLDIRGDRVGPVVHAQGGGDELGRRLAAGERFMTGMWRVHPDGTRTAGHAIVIDGAQRTTLPDGTRGWVLRGIDPFRGRIEIPAREARAVLGDFRYAHFIKPPKP